MAGPGFTHFQDVKYYQANCSLQKKVGEDFVQHVADIVDDLSVEGHAPFVICDYGSGCGSTSESLIQYLMEQLTPRLQGTAQFQLFFNDVHTTDFRPVFERYQDAAKSVNKGNRQVYLAAVGTSYMQQIFPNASVDFGMTYFACHWLSERPCPLSNGLFACLPEQKKEEQAAWDKQISTDWESFLVARSRELKKDAFLTVVMGEQMIHTYHLSSIFLFRYNIIFSQAWG